MVNRRGLGIRDKGSGRREEMRNEKAQIFRLR